MELRAEDIQEILRIFAESELEELKLEVGETRLHVSKNESGSTWSEASTARPASSPARLPTESGRATAGELRAAAPDAASASPSVAAAAGAAAASDRATPVQGLFELRSPLLGVFYRRPSPDQPPFVEVGTEVDVDDPVCIVDVMKMFTQIRAGSRGRIAEICVEDGQLVEHGQVLMRIEPAEAR